MTTRVHYQEESFDIFIGRPSKWSNPFPIRKDRSREEAVRLYEKWIRKKYELLADLHELEGKVLGCWCKKGELCHGDVLIKLIDEMNVKLYSHPGILRYSEKDGYRLVVEVNQSLSDYYRSLIPKSNPVRRPGWNAHITVVRPGKEIPVNLDRWKEHEGEQVQFLYDPFIRNNEMFYWLNIWCVRLEEIRRDLGLSVVSPAQFRVPPRNHTRSFHCTIGDVR